MEEGDGEVYGYLPTVISLTRDSLSVPAILSDLWHVTHLDNVRLF